MTSEPLSVAPVDAGRRGRPRDASADEAILSATAELLAIGGIAGWSMDDVARRAGVGKATIYRRWPSKEQLVIDAISTTSRSETPDTGSVRNDLLAYGEALAEAAAQPASDVLPHLIEAACYDERLRESLNEYTRSRQTAVRKIIDRGFERGELTDADDKEMLVDVLLGTFFYRRLVSGRPYTRRYASKLVDFALRSARLPT